MNENINLVEILKDAPNGTKLYSPILGECELYMLDVCSEYPIKVTDKANNIICLLSDGRYSNYPNGECLLFPSKDNRDWSTFKAPWKHKHFEPFQKVLIASCANKVWDADIYCFYDAKHNIHRCMCHNVSDNHIIPYKGSEDKLGKPVDK